MGYIKELTLRGTKGFDRFMRDRLHWRLSTRSLVFYYLGQFQEQVLAVVPVTLCLVITLAIYFGRTVENPGKLTGGLLSAMFGLVLFVDGLRVAIMPMGSMLGQQLPQHFRVRYILIIACAVGILCTYAEPAIASLRPLADLVQRCNTPYLFYILNDMNEMLVLSIGLGVGVAAMIGVLRFLRGWSLKPLIACSLGPTIVLSCYMKWGDPDLAPLIGLAWDCGAVTTGPVTVPILLSLGIGVMKGQKSRAAAREVVEATAGTASGGQALEGFGIITLASMFPIMAVETLAVVLSFMYTAEEIGTDFGRIDCSTFEQELSFSSVSDGQVVLDSMITAVRSILPLNVFLILLITCVLRKALPTIKFDVPVDPLLLPDLDQAPSAADLPYDPPTSTDPAKRSSWMTKRFGGTKTVTIGASALPTTLTHVEEAFGDGALRRRGAAGGDATASTSMAGAADGSSLISGEPPVPSVDGTLGRTNSGQTRESVAALSECDSDAGAEETCVYQGPVLKRSRHNNGEWRSRYFVLYQGILRMYSSVEARDRGDALLGSVSLKNAVIAELSGGADDGFQFTIIDSKGVRRVCACAAAADRDCWMAALREAVEWSARDKQRRKDFHAEVRAKQKESWATAIEHVTEKKTRPVPMREKSRGHQTRETARALHAQNQKTLQLNVDAELEGLAESSVPNSASATPAAAQSSPSAPSAWPKAPPPTLLSDVAVAIDGSDQPQQRPGPQSPRGRKPGREHSFAEPSSHPDPCSPAQPRLDMSARENFAAGQREKSLDVRRPALGGGPESWMRSHLMLLLGIVESIAGMMLFNIGLTFGFTSLGDASGSLLPSAFIQTADELDSPYYDKTSGIVIVLVTVFVLGFLATRAEPALRVMGKTVETLSEGQFSANMLVYTVCVGVGCGMVLGSSKILFGVNVIWLILIKYCIACSLTFFSSENFTNIAWDSAGVTTGPVTVPFVLSLGIGFSKAKNAQEGFGILTCASVAPIIWVLLTDRLRVMYVKAAKIYVERRRRNMASVAVQCEPAEQEHEALLAKVYELEGIVRSLKASGSSDGAMAVVVDRVATADTETQYEVEDQIAAVEMYMRHGDAMEGAC